MGKLLGEFAARAFGDVLTFVSAVVGGKILRKIRARIVPIISLRKLREYNELYKQMFIILFIYIKKKQCNIRFIKSRKRFIICLFVYINKHQYLNDKYSSSIINLISFISSRLGLLLRKHFGTGSGPSRSNINIKYSHSLQTRIEKATAEVK